MYKLNIKLEEVKAGMKLAGSVYHITDSGVHMLIARKNSDLTPSILRVLTGLKIETVDVLSRTPKPETHVPVKTLFDTMLRKKAVESVKQLFSCFSEEGCTNKTTAFRCVNNISGIVGDLLDVINNDLTGLIHINDLKKHDEYTYHHSLSVSVLAIATGRELGMDNDELLRLGRCAMLHDIGKQLIPLDIINKTGKLTAAEYEIIQKHPIWGANNLRDSSLIDEESVISILSHHEKENGLGYPYRLKSHEIPLFSKIIAVADVYDAITSYRAYRAPMQPLEAFEIIYKDINNSFDYDIVRAFYNRLEFFPVNTIVELSDRRIALVVHTGKLKLRPTVRIWSTDEFINLENSKDLCITRALNPSELPAGFEFL